MKKNSIEETRNEYRRLKKAAKKSVARAMNNAVRKINELGRNPDNVSRLGKKMKIESTDVVGGRYMRGNDGTLHLNENDRAKLWKAHK